MQQWIPRNYGFLDWYNITTGGLTWYITTGTGGLQLQLWRAHSLLFLRVRVFLLFDLANTHTLANEASYSNTMSCSQVLRII